MSLLRFAPLRRAGLVVGLLLAGAYVTIALLGPNGVKALQRQQQELEQLQEENADLVKLRDELKHTAGALESDPAMQELITREKLGKAKKGEVVIKVDVPKEGASQEKDKPE